MPERRIVGTRCHVWICAALIAAVMISTAGAQQTSRPELYFVAMGDVPVDMVTGLVSHFQTRFGVPIKTLSPLGFDRTTFDPQRSQAVADRLIQAVRYRYPTLAKAPATRVIAITSMDMYMESMREQWSFAFSMRSRDRRFAVISYARMDPVNLGEPRDDALLRTRLRKMLTKNIGIMYFGLPASDNPRSALFRDILAVDDLDRMTEDFDPK